MDEFIMAMPATVECSDATHHNSPVNLNHVKSIGFMEDLSAQEFTVCFTGINDPITGNANVLWLFTDKKDYATHRVNIEGMMNNMGSSPGYGL